MKAHQPIIVIGGGLAGCEAVWQLRKRSHPVVLYEMKPQKFSPAHRSPLLAELVCSNSLRSSSLDNAVGLLKEEMRRLGSIVMETAETTSVPAGKALAVDRKLFSETIEEKLSSSPKIQILREEVTDIPKNAVTIIATGPLTSDALAKKIKEFTESGYLYFYDAISPVVHADSIDRSAVFRASRYQEGEGDYLNCPMDKKQYEIFWKELVGGQEVPLWTFEDIRCFEGCLPVEIMARRGVETLRFGPMKPVGLIDPRTGREPHAAVQLRQENREATLYNLVGFQTKLTWPEQSRILRMIPGLEKAEFARYGSIHRNTFIHSPALLENTLQLKTRREILFAGQITGVEGYLESAAMGLLAGISASCLVKGVPFTPPPRTTAIGALVHHITDSEQKTFQPMNVNFGLFVPLPGRKRKRDRGRLYAERSLNDLEAWKKGTR